MKANTNEKIVRSFMVLDLILKVSIYLSLFVAVALAVTVLAGLFAMSSSGTDSKFLENWITCLIKGVILIIEFVQLKVLRDAFLDIWKNKTEFNWEQSTTEDRGLWVNAGVQTLVVVFLLLLLTI